MGWFRDAQSPHGTWLRTLVVLGLVFAVVAETPLGGSWAAPTHPGTPGEPELAAPATTSKQKCKKSKNSKRRKQCGKKNTDIGQAPSGPSAPAPSGPTDPGPVPVPSPTPVPPPDPKPDAELLAAGDIATCSSSGDEATAALLDGRQGTVAALGDNVYESGTPGEFADCYDPSWGRHKSRTRPAVGNHEYLTGGAAGYYGYFGAAAGDPTKGYYSYELGSWHIVVLNTNCAKVGGCHQGSPQEQWLRQDLAAHPMACTLAYWHHPRYSFDLKASLGDDAHSQPLWEALYEHGAEVVLTGHAHNYQRYTPLDASGVPDPARGIRQFVVGTGGANLTTLGIRPSTAEAGNDDTFGILQLTLHPTSYEWEFIPVAGRSYTDTGSTACH